MTPSHDGSMTPRHGAWDPTANTTPARNTDFDYSLEEPSPSPGYNPSTSFIFILYKILTFKSKVLLATKCHRNLLHKHLVLFTDLIEAIAHLTQAPVRHRPHIQLVI